MQENENPTQNQSDEDILITARQRFDLVAEAEAEIRKLALEDTEFSVGDQWDERIVEKRRRLGRPVLTINRLPQFIRQIENDARQNRPAIRISPVDDRADIETAKVYQGLIRHIEYASDADTAYVTALGSAARRSFGYFRVVAEYCDPLSFYQDLRIKRIRNPFSCYLDPSYQNPDGSDANFGFVTEDISAETYKATYPKSKLATASDWESLGNNLGEWISKDTVRVAEYFYKEFQSKRLLLLSDGTTILEDEIKDGAELSPGIKIVDARETLVPIVHHLKINGIEILERTIWPGRFIPIIPVLGDEIDVGGKRILEGVVRHAKDSQRMYNFWATSETETIALAPRAPWLGAAGQFEGHEDKWSTANTENHAFLEYNHLDEHQNPLPPPQRQVYEPPVQAITNARMLAGEDMKATTGIYDAAMGAQSNETSGIAIQRRNIQSQTSNFHFMDNLSKSIRHCGRILLDAIPHIYDTARAVRLLDEDGTEEVVRINELFQHKGETVHYRFGVGKYDVTVSTGPSFETKRQEASMMMADLVRSYPQLMEIAGDILVRNLDLPGSQDLAERIRKMLPEGMVEDKDKKPIPPEVQAQITQMSQLIDTLTEQLKEKTKIVEMKTLELESKERIEMAKLQTQAEIKLAELGSAEGLALLRSEIEAIQARMNMLRIDEPIEHPQQEQEFQNAPAGPEESALDFNQQPTGGPQAPGQYMEDLP